MLGPACFGRIVPEADVVEQFVPAVMRSRGVGGKSIVLVPLLNPKFAIELAAWRARTSGSGH